MTTKLANVQPKKWYESRTLWIAVAQAVVGIIVVITNEFPDAEIVGSLVALKSVFDIGLRFMTDVPIDLK